MSAKKAINKEIEENKEITFEFPKRKIKIEIIDRVVSPIIKDDQGSEGVRMAGTTLSFGLPTTNLGFVDPFAIYAKMEGQGHEFAKAVRLKLEESLNLKKGALITSLPTPEQIDESIWCKPSFKIVLRKRTRDLSSATITLDLSQPVDFLKYLVALGSDKCSNSYGERFNAMTYLATVRDDSIDREIELTLQEKRSEANARIYMLKKEGEKNNNNSKLFALYGLLELNVKQFTPSRRLNSSSHIGDIFSELISALEKPTTLGKLLEYSEYSDSLLDEYFTFFRGKEHGAVKLIQGRWLDNKGRSIGTSVQEVIDWFNKEENAGLKLALKSNN